MKKYVKYILFCFSLMFMCVLPVFADLSTGKIEACHEPSVIRAFKILSMCIAIIKVLLPVIIILVSTKNLVVAVIGGDDAAIKKSVSIFITRIIVGIFIFFVPTLVNAVMNTVGYYSNVKAGFVDCGKCLTDSRYCDSLISVYGN